MPVALPEDIAAAFVEAWMARDAQELASHFTEDADFVNVVGIWWENRADIERAHHYGLTTFFSESKLTAGRVKTRHLGKDVALVHARMILTGQLGKDGDAAGRRTTILSFVMQRLEDGWMCVSAHNTDIVPGAETFEAGGNGLSPRDYRT